MLGCIFRSVLAYPAPLVHLTWLDTLDVVVVQVEGLSGRLSIASRSVLVGLCLPLILCASTVPPAVRLLLFLLYSPFPRPDMMDDDPVLVFAVQLLHVELWEEVLSILCFVPDSVVVANDDYSTELEHANRNRVHLR